MFNKVFERFTGKESGPSADRVLGLDAIGPDQGALGQRMRSLVELGQKGRINTLAATVQHMPAAEFQAVASHFSRMLNEGPTKNAAVDAVFAAVRERMQMGDIMTAHRNAAEKTPPVAKAVPAPVAINADEMPALN